MIFYCANCCAKVTSGWLPKNELSLCTVAGIIMQTVTVAQLSFFCVHCKKYLHTIIKAFENVKYKLHWFRAVQWPILCGTHMLHGAALVAVVSLSSVGLPSPAHTHCPHRHRHRRRHHHYHIRMTLGTGAARININKNAPPRALLLPKTWQRSKCCQMHFLCHRQQQHDERGCYGRLRCAGWTRGDQCWQTLLQLGLTQIGLPLPIQFMHAPQTHT